MDKNNREQRNSKKLQGEIRKYLVQVKKLLKRGGKKLPKDIHAQILDAKEALRKELADPEGQWTVAHENLEKLVDKHLGFAKKSTTMELVESLLFALMFALVLRAFIIEPFKIPTRSMVPTLLDGDQLFVTKLSYGLRIPIWGKQLVKFSNPQRGDVIVFAFPTKDAMQYLIQTNSNCMKTESLSKEKDYIKRVIGVEGDSIEVIDQILHVNGEPVERTVLYQREVNDFFFLSDKRAEIWSQENLGGIAYTTITHEVPVSHFGPVKVKPGHLFVMGDNRDNSADSRCWGQVPIDNVIGKAQFIWVSSDSNGFRLERMFTKIH